MDMETRDRCEEVKNVLDRTMFYSTPCLSFYATTAAVGATLSEKQPQTKRMTSLQHKHNLNRVDFSFNLHCFIKPINQPPKQRVNRKNTILLEILFS